ncbi:hypothetical protein [Chroococcidiopsis sp. CCMEE 29]|uniref:hypothetical protein n=1 Tax=Chroococcidiopsis sp. CCMEE 29 TaxID=155894 RepID=UPI00201FC9AE|nr:hypothetical protein [Chroococcidiopsis sp. CCMEE 29]
MNTKTAQEIETAIPFLISRAAISAVPYLAVIVGDRRLCSLENTLSRECWMNFSPLNDSRIAI